MISVPYAGTISAAGRSPLQVQRTIEKRLASKAIEPQAIVSVTANQSRLATVSGEIQQGGRIPLSNIGERVLDAIALSGGPRGAAYETRVKLTRGGRSADMLLQRLINSPSDNIPLQPGDQIFLYKKSQKFAVLGATTTNSEIDFESDSLTLAEAIARAGGLDDKRADPAGVFVFRFEDANIHPKISHSSAREGEPYPVVYRLDMKQPTSLLSAQRFPVRDKDVLYFANSPSTELSKFLQLLGSSVSSTGGTITVAAKVIK
jgi:polysaccharide export outer membrane protein